jgi:hypothetical protein
MNMLPLEIVLGLQVAALLVIAVHLTLGATDNSKARKKRMTDEHFED